MSKDSISVPQSMLLELAKLIIDAVNLDITPEKIDPNMPLYGEGLGLDSIDILEVALVASKHFGVQLRAEDNENHEVFTSLNTLATRILELQIVKKQA